MQSELENALVASRLHESEAAARALGDGQALASFGRLFVVTESFIATYVHRAEYVKAVEGEHWQRLAASTGEFAENLRSVVGATMEFITIKGSAEPYFLVARAVEGGRIVGCMRVIPGGQAALPGANEPHPPVNMASVDTSMMPDSVYFFVAMRGPAWGAEVFDGPDSVVLRLHAGGSGIRRVAASDRAGKPLLQVERTRRFPRCRYVMSRDGKETGTLDALNLLRTKFAIEFAGGASWRFSMPLFTARFYARSSAGVHVEVQMQQEGRWVLSFDAGQDSADLLAALALIFLWRYATI